MPAPANRDRALARGITRRTSERCVHLPEAVPDGERTVILPPVVVVDTGDVDVRAVGKPEPSVPVERRHRLPQPRRIARRARGLAEARPGEQSVRIGQAGFGAQGPPVAAVLHAPVVLRPSGAGPARQEPSGREDRPPPPSRHDLPHRNRPAGAPHSGPLPAVAGCYFFFGKPKTISASPNG